VRKGAPRYGEHTREVLREYGFDDGEIERFIGEGAIVAPADDGARQRVA
jgi:crotonobetainyl-CoA:carnitine CoA-transferase CaiB-like acyl-CoA transferase